MTGTVVWSFRAGADIRRIVKHVAQDNPVAAARLARELIIAGDSLATFPRRIGRKPGTCELIAMPPYIIVYRIGSPDAVRILRIWHAAQDRP